MKFSMLRTALYFVLNKAQPMSSCADVWRTYGGSKLLPGYYPAKFESRRQWRDLVTQAKKLCFGNGKDDRTIFDDEKLKWTQTSYVSTQMHPYDLYFYDPVKHSYTIDKFVDDVRSRYGGLDSMLVWPVYPTLGIDNRNMFDLFDALPGGRAELRKQVELLDSKYGIKVLIPFTPWERNTRFCDNCSQNSDEEVGQHLLKLLNDTGAYGFNGDTMDFVSKDDYYSKYSMKGVAIEPEGMGTAEMRTWHTMGWGYWNNWNGPVPGIDLWKQAFDARWMTHACERWSKNHTNYIQTAYMNGVGFNA